MTTANSKKEYNALIILQAVKQIIELFSGPFLITYFGRIAENPSVSLSVYYILYYGFMALGAVVLSPIVNRKFQLGLYRLGILINFLYFLVFIFLGDKVVDYVFVVGVLAGLSGACYWYPLSLLKAIKIGEQERANFFSTEKITITLVACIGPILLGSLISRESYVRTAVIVACVSAVQFGLTFLLKPVREIPGKKYDLIGAVKGFFAFAKLKQVFLEHVLIGITIGGVALKSVSTLVLHAEGLDDVQIGFATSVCSALTIVLVAIYKRLNNRQRNIKPYFAICGILPVIAFGLAALTGNMIVYLIFFTLSLSLPVVLQTAHNVHIFEAVGENGDAKEQRGEYLAFMEVILTAGRCLPCAIMIPFAAAGNLTGMYIINWILVLCLPVLSFVTGRYGCKK